MITRIDVKVVDDAPQRFQLQVPITDKLRTTSVSVLALIVCFCKTVLHGNQDVTGERYAVSKARKSQLFQRAFHNATRIQ